MKYRNQILPITRGALIAALYVVLTLLSGAMGLAFGPIQVRISDALCILAAFFPEAVPGLTLGCVISNFFSPLGAGMIGDMIFGSLATMLGAIGARFLCRHPILIPLPTVLANTLIVPMVLSVFYGAEEAFPYLMLTVGIGEILSAWVLGLALMGAIRPVLNKYRKE